MIMNNFFSNWSNDEKGKFIQNVLYDYYWAYSYNPYIISKDEDGSQRFGKNLDMVMPDLMIFDHNQDLFFVESKSIFNISPGEYDFFTISKELESCYLNFYKKVFPARKNFYEYTIPTTIVFSKVYEEYILSYFLNIEQLGELERRNYYDNWNRPVYLFSEQNIAEKAYDVQTFHFEINDSLISVWHNGIILSDDVMNIENGQNRESLIYPTEADMISDLKKYMTK